MTTMWKLFNPEDFWHGLNEGLIREQQHPEFDLLIYNYTDKAQYTPGAWDNPAVRQCRGLIVDNNARIIARPLPKFFNHGQPEAPRIDPAVPATVYDKVDGSLGILYRTGRTVPGAGLLQPEYAVATRGSFTSEQALHATEVWSERYQGLWAPRPGYTALFEIVYPDNRIVLDYGDRDDLILLGAVHMPTGEFLAPDHIASWPGSRAQRMPHRTLGEALAAPPRPNAEGFVVHSYRGIVKVKQEDYLRLHRIITGLNERVVWEHLDGKLANLPSLLEGLPDEFHGWVKDVATGLFAELQRTMRTVSKEYLRITMSLPAGCERKDFALKAKQSEHRAYLFLMHDDRDIRPAIWKSLKPAGDSRPFAQLEDAA